MFFATFAFVKEIYANTFHFYNSMLPCRLYAGAHRIQDDHLPIRNDEEPSSLLLSDTLRMFAPGQTRIILFPLRHLPPCLPDFVLHLRELLRQVLLRPYHSVQK